MSEPAAPPAFIVSGQWPGGSVRYLCPTAASALAKLRDFEKSGYVGITITRPDGRALTEADLVRLQGQEAEPEGGAPVDPGAVSAPALVP